ncbi:uncharacterized protein LOC125217882 [Salvia hispanica]|uniref:uncharacterized protein LOC125217882 n=1 Tax=Salvia hispanica TaxID=49212 RepID=UPI0020098471|nr:uncharacterized protein LOC125217882 [Salvia hispanica]
MGYKQSPALIVVALLLLATATPLAYGQLPRNPTGFVTGAICCTSSGTCTPGAVRIPGVALRLNCTTLLGNVVTLAQGVTNATGVFNLTLPNPLGPVINTILPYFKTTRLLGPERKELRL